MMNSIRSAILNIDTDISLRSISSVGANDILDIIIVAVVTYFILIWLKETRAWSLIRGFLVLLIVSILAILLNLSTVNWIIANSFNIGLIALVVIFQPELRRALEHIGRGNILDAFSKNNNGAITPENIEEIISAIFEMASTKTGALVLIEQQVPLGEIETSGVLLDALLSKQALMNIFYYGAPLHDGAVVIRGNRIAAASCILPLTSSKIDQKLGTRHRAAVGAAEVSDAYILIVSEETGFVSVANNSKLYRKVGEPQIRRMLLPKEEKKKDSNKLKDAIKNIRGTIKNKGRGDGDD